MHRFSSRLLRDALLRLFFVLSTYPAAIRLDRLAVLPPAPASLGGGWDRIRWARSGRRRAVALLPLYCSHRELDAAGLRAKPRETE